MTAASVPVVETVGVPPTAVTVPFNVKSSNLQVPVPVAPEFVITIVTTPVKLFTGLLTFVTPNNAAVVGIVPEPAFIPLIVMEKFCAPEVLLTL